METKHTCGEWFYDKETCTIRVERKINDENVDIIIIADLFGALGGDDTDADLKLMVASPKMLEALKAAKKCLNDNGLFGCTIIDEAIKKATE